MKNTYRSGGAKQYGGGRGQLQEPDGHQERIEALTRLAELGLPLTPDRSEKLPGRLAAGEYRDHRSRLR